MKTRIKSFAALLIIALLSITPIYSPAQNGDPPPPPGEQGQTGNQPPGGGAPIAGGIGILLALGAAYGGKKVYDYRMRKKFLKE